MAKKAKGPGYNKPGSNEEKRKAAAKQAKLLAELREADAKYKEEQAKTAVFGLYSITRAIITEGGAVLRDEHGFTQEQAVAWMGETLARLQHLFQNGERPPGLPKDWDQSAPFMEPAEAAGGNKAKSDGIPASWLGVNQQKDGETAVNDEPAGDSEPDNDGGG